MQKAPAGRRSLQGRSPFGRVLRARNSPLSRFCAPAIRVSLRRGPLRYCSKSTSLLSRKKASATRAIRAMPPRYQPSDWMPKFMTRADAMVGANAPPVMAARL